MSEQYVSGNGTNQDSKPSRGRHLQALCLALGLAEAIAARPAAAQDWLLPSQPRRLRALTYNVWALPHVLIRKPGRLREIARALPYTQAEVIGLQETFNTSARVFAEIPEYPFVARGPGSSFLHSSSGLMILSKHPIVETATLVYRDCSGMDCFANKGAQYARIQTEDLGEIDVVNTHMNASDRGELRERQLSQLIPFIEEHTGNRPLLLLGDFNFPPDSPSYARLMNHLRVIDGHVEQFSTRPTRELASEPEPGFTADPVRNLNLSNKKRSQKRIDYTFFREAAHLAVRVISSKLAFDQPVDGIHLSDHFGVLTEIEVAPQLQPLVHLPSEHTLGALDAP